MTTFYDRLHLVVQHILMEWRGGHLLHCVVPHPVQLDLPRECTLLF
jgi:hypothetical protein